MSPVKYHISPTTGRANQCKAFTKGCPLKSEDGITPPHFDSKEAANLYLEREAAQANPEHLSGAKKSTKTRAPSQEEAPPSPLKPLLKPQEREAILQAATLESLPSLQEAGRLFDAAVKRSLSFDPFSGELTPEQLREIQEVNQKVLAELVPCGDPPAHEGFEGGMAKYVKEVTKFLPNHAKTLMGDTVIIPKTVSSRNQKIGGYFSMGRIKRKVPATGHLHEGSWITKTDCPDGVLFGDLTTFESEFADETRAHRMAVRDSSALPDSRGRIPQRSVWLGDSLGRKGFRKIADEAQVYLGGSGKIVTIKKPVYAMVDTEFRQGATLGVQKDADPEVTRSRAIHEYTHVVQNSPGFREKNTELELFGALAEEKTYSVEYQAVQYKGFPHPYMGDKSRAEVFPVATEGVFAAGSATRGFLYGGERHKNADAIRTWVLGTWVALGKK